MKPFLKSKKHSRNDRVVKILIELNIKPVDFSKDEIISKDEIANVLARRSSFDKEDIYYLCKKYDLNPFYIYHGMGEKKLDGDGVKYFFNIKQDVTINNKSHATNIRISKILNKLNVKPSDFAEDEIISRPKIHDVLNSRSSLDYNEIYYLSKKYNLNPFFLIYGIGKKMLADDGKKYFFLSKTTEEINTVNKISEKKLLTKKKSNEFSTIDNTQPKSIELLKGIEQNTKPKKSTLNLAIIISFLILTVAVLNWIFGSNIFGRFYKNPTDENTKISQPKIEYKKSEKLNLTLKGDSPGKIRDEIYEVQDLLKDELKKGFIGQDVIWICGIRNTKRLENGKVKLTCSQKESNRNNFPGILFDVKLNDYPKLDNLKGSEYTQIKIFGKVDEIKGSGDIIMLKVSKIEFL